MKNEKTCLYLLNVEGRRLALWANEENYSRFLEGDENAIFTAFDMETGTDLRIEFKDGMLEQIVSF